MHYLYQTHANFVAYCGIFQVIKLVCCLSCRFLFYTILQYFRILLCGMAEAAGVTVSELARKIISCDTKQHLELLRRYHTQQTPELSQLFDELDICVAHSPNTSITSANNQQTTDFNNRCLENDFGHVGSAVASTSKLTPATILGIKTGKISKKSNNCKKYQRASLRKVTEQTSASNKRRDQRDFTSTHLGRVRNCWKILLKNESDNSREKECVGGTRIHNDNRVRMRTRTVIPETDSDISTVSDTDDANASDNYIPPSPELNNIEYCANTVSNTISLSEHNDLDTRICSTSSKLHHLTPHARELRLKRIRRNCSAHHDVEFVNDEEQQNTVDVSEEQSDKQESSDYNEVLAGLLFEESSMQNTVHDKPNTHHKGQKSFSNCSSKVINNVEDNDNSCSYESDEKNSVSTASVGYNKVLDTLLFGESPASKNPSSETEGRIPQSPSSPCAYSVHTIDTLFSPTDEESSTAGKGNGRTGTDSGSHVNRYKRPLLSSQELRDSPWGTLECDLGSL